MLKGFRVVFGLLLIFRVSPTLIAEESVNNYFPHTSGSFWVYEDQVGGEINTTDEEGCRKMRFMQPSVP